MTRRETGIVAFAVLTLVLAVVVVLGRVSFPPTAQRHLPTLNGPPPAATPGSATGAPTAPSPPGSTSRLQPAMPNVALTRLEPGEDETEDEPASAEGAPSRSTGSSSGSASGSGGQSLLPGGPHLPVPPAPALPALSPLIPKTHRENLTLIGGGLSAGTTVSFAPSVTSPS
jgi:hypothetical protein